jgi:hypothetical protein
VRADARPPSLLAPAPLARMLADARPPRTPCICSHRAGAGRCMTDPRNPCTAEPEPPHSLHLLLTRSPRTPCFCSFHAGAGPTPALLSSFLEPSPLALAGMLAKPHPCKTALLAKPHSLHVLLTRPPLRDPLKLARVASPRRGPTTSARPQLASSLWVRERSVFSHSSSHSSSPRRTRHLVKLTMASTR